MFRKSKGSSVERMLVVHVPSGEIFGLEERDNEITSVVGPLSPSESLERNILDELDWVAGEEDAEWAQQQQWRYISEDTLEERREALQEEGKYYRNSFGRIRRVGRKVTIKELERELTEEEFERLFRHGHPTAWVEFVINDKIVMWNPQECTFELFSRW